MTQASVATERSVCVLCGNMSCTYCEQIDAELARGSGLSVITIVELIVASAHEARASDVHFDPRQEGLLVRRRVDGVLKDAHLLPKEIHHEVISRIKILAGLRIDEHFGAQDGRFRAVVGDDVCIDVRVSVVPTYHGENAVLRLLAPTYESFDLSSLGFTKHNAALIERALAQTCGLILATGPTGSGKTTTLYTLLQKLHTPDISIITIEDPIEYSLAGINQIQTMTHSGLTFANGLRSILRQDPDVIMVGEIRDAETAGIAINTALTGHLVLSTLHTSDAPTTLPRLLDMGIEPYLIASTMSLAIAQRLVRRVCEVCKEPRVFDENDLANFPEDARAELTHPKAVLYYSRGCSACNRTGYRGRTGIHEVMTIDDTLREAIARRASTTEIRAIALQGGMVPMYRDGLRKVARGITTIEEVLRTYHD